ncbi:MAG: hypothetical protein JNL98_21625 [Bryobacterales bacterium]|nr:hypothetical protein [Bryobacterales bacterium]
MAGHDALAVPADEPIREYRGTLTANTPIFLLPRRFVCPESWTKETTEDGSRYLGLFRELEPDLEAILTHPRILILGEAGAGKTLTTRAIVQHVVDRGHPNEIPIPVSLKSYSGNLRELITTTAPIAVLDNPKLTRIYILDGIDEVPTNYRTAIPPDINRLLTNDGNARIILTSRQAFAAQHPEAFPPGITTFHLLDFDDQDIGACATHRGITPDEFLTAVRDVDCEEEIRNPFVLNAMLERYRDHGKLSKLRSDNVGYVVDRLIQSRPLFNTTRQKRALRMLAITCETTARNELTEEEALRVLLEAIDFPREAARQLLDELSRSILIRTPRGISFQMRSYGEYLAADELHDKPVDRLKELAFLGDTPIDTWLNTVTYLAEINDKVRQYFVQRHPEWLVNVSPAAFTEDERTTLARLLLRDINQSQTYLVNQETIPPRRLSRLLTPPVITDLRAQLTGTQPHEVANALILLGILQQADIAPQALRLVLEHRNWSSLRYAAIVALIHTNDNSVIDDLIGFAQRDDTYYIHIIDAIGSLCTPADFPRVLPLLEHTRAGLSSAYYHFRELTTKEALNASIDYLTQSPATLTGYDLDSYLEPLIDLIPTHWDRGTGISVGMLLAAVERARLFTLRGKLAQKIINHVGARDHEAIAVQTMVTSLAADGTCLRHTADLIAPLITPKAANWIKEHTPQYAGELFPRLAPGPARDLLDQRTTGEVQAHQEALAQLIEYEQQREHQIVTTRVRHQDLIRAGRDINAITGACERLPKEHWPEITPDQREWLADAVTETLLVSCPV